MDAITFRYLIHLAVSEGLEMHLMDVVTTYLYGSIDSDIYMKIPEGFTLPEAKIFKTTWYVFNKVATILVWTQSIWSNVVQSFEYILIERRICK